ncbi:MAG TPA: PepSY domain-containing protein [Dongiaceae bacterium]
MNFRQSLTSAFGAGALLVAGSLFAANAQAQTTTTQTQTTETKSRTTVRSDVPADLAKQAKISLETARTTALAKVPNGEVRSEELEKEHGKLISPSTLRCRASRASRRSTSAPSPAR